MAIEPVVVLFLEPMSPGAKELFAISGKSRAIEVMPIPSLPEAMQAALQFQPCVLVLTTHNEIDATEQLAMLKRLEKNIKSGHIKVMVISTLKNNSYAKSYSDLGIQDYTEEPIAARSLMFKLNLAFKSILGLRKIQEQERKAGEKIVFRSEGKKEEPKIKIDPLKGEIAPKYKAALQLGEDIFVFKNSKPKKVGKKFIIQAEGPSPETGEWRLEPELGGEKREQQWRWVEKTEDGILAKDHENDGWILTGEKPVFNNDSQQWQFCAEKPELSYRKQGTIAGKKLETDSEGELLMAEDSRIALDNLMVNKTLANISREEKNNRREMEKASNSAASSSHKAFLEKKSEKKESTSKEEKNPFNKSAGREAFRNLMGEKNETAPYGSYEGSHEPEEEKSDLVRKRRKNPFEANEKNDFSDILKNSDREEVSDFSVGEDLKNEIQRGDLDPEKRESRKTGVSGFSKIFSPQPNFEEGKEKKDFSQEKKSPRESSKGKEQPWKPGRSLSLKQSSDSEEEAEGVEDVADLENEESELEKDFQRVDRERDEILGDLQRDAVDQGQVKTRKLSIQAKKSSAKRNREHPSPETIQQNEKKESFGTEHPERESVDHKEKARESKSGKKQKLEKSVSDQEKDSESYEPLTENEVFNEMIEEERVEASGEGKRRVFRAFDSWEEPDPKEFAGKEKKPKRLGADREYFLDRNEVFPLEGAWRNSEGAWVYLPLAESDQGFDSVAKMMPLWIYRGKFEPELLLENKWKFLGRAPELFENVEDLPRLIVRFLERLLNTEAVSDEDVPDKNRAELERKNPFSGGNSEAPLLESRGEKRGSDPQRLRLEEEAEAGIKSKKARASDEEFSEIPEIEKEDPYATGEFKDFEERESRNKKLKPGTGQKKSIGLGEEQINGSRQEMGKRSKTPKSFGEKSSMEDVHSEAESGMIPDFPENEERLDRQKSEKRNEEISSREDAEAYHENAAGGISAGVAENPLFLEEKEFPEKSENSAKDPDEFHDARSRNERGALIAGLEKHLKNDSGALPKESGNPANELEMETPQQETSGEKIHLNSREALALALISDLAQKKSCGTSDIDVAIRALERAFKGWQFSFGANSENAIDLSGGFYAIQGEVEGPERAISVFKYFEKSFQRLQERVRKSGNWKDVA